MMRRLLIAVMLLLMPLPALAVLPDEILKDPVLEERARKLSSELRCMVCQNQSIDESDAELARDLRILVRERLTEGDSDEAVIDYVVSRYGEFVLLNPRFSMRNAALWFIPVILLIGGALGFMVYLRSRAKVVATAPLSATEEQRIKDLLGQ
jgi:cytochrome c-type biogenesis protein CcmH